MLLFVIYILIAVVIGWFGANRKFGFWGYFFAAALLTPLIGVLLVIASDPRPPRRRECGCLEERL